MNFPASIVAAFKHKKIECAIFILMALAPTIHLAFGDWNDTVFNAISFLSLLGIYLDKTAKPFNRRQNAIFLLLFISYPAAIFISQLARWQWRIHDYLDQGRFLLAIPVFIYLAKKNFNYKKQLEIFLPLALIASYFATKYLYRDVQYGTDRLANNFIDVVGYGQICISMSLVILAMVERNDSKGVFFTFWKILGLAFGVLISIETQSRTGWFSILGVIAFLLWINREHIKGKSFALLFFLIIGASYVLFNEIHIIHQRLFEAYLELKNYPWSGGVAPYGSVSLRITFFRIGWFYFTHSPWYGWGEKGFVGLMNSPELLAFASKYAIDYSYVRLFHNELVTQMVRYGMLGVLGYIMVFVVTTAKLASLLNHPSEVVRSNAILAIVFLLTQIFS